MVDAIGHTGLPCIDHTSPHADLRRLKVLGLCVYVVPESIFAYWLLESRVVGNRAAQLEGTHEDRVLMIV